MFELKLGTRSVAVKSIAEAQAYVDSGKANPDTAIRKAGATEWQKVKNVRGVDFSVPVATPGMTSSRKDRPQETRRETHEPKDSAPDPTLNRTQWIMAFISLPQSHGAMHLEIAMCVKQAA